MRKAILVAVAVLALGSASCAVADTLFGTRHNADGSVTTTGTGGAVGGIASFLGFGWVTTIIGAATTAYAAWKGRGWKAAAVSTFDAVEAWKQTPDGRAKWESLKEKLGEAHAEAHVTALVDSALGNS